MAVLYVYTDLSDNIKKYVGIVWSDNRTLKQRIDEHEKDEWAQGKCWKIEYLQKEITCRTDAEFLEAHYINKFKTFDYYNIKKANWGDSKLIDDSKDEWVVYRIDEKPVSKWIKECEIKSITHNTEYANGIKGIDFELSDGSNYGMRIYAHINKTAYKIYLPSLLAGILKDRNYFIKELKIENFFDYIKDKLESEPLICQTKTSEITGEIEELIIKDIVFVVSSNGYHMEIKNNAALIQLLKEYEIPLHNDIVTYVCEEDDSLPESIILDHDDCVNYKTIVEGMFQNKQYYADVCKRIGDYILSNEDYISNDAYLKNQYDYYMKMLQSESSDLLAG